MDLPAKLLTGVVLVLALGLGLKAYGDDDNRINIIQVGKGDNLDLTITQEGFDNNIFFSIGDGDDILLDLLQVGNNNEIGYANDYPSWGSGVSWGGDVDFDDQELKLWQNCTKNSSCNKNDIQFHISYGTDNKLWWSQGYIIDDRNDTNWSKDNTEGGGHNVTIDIHGNDNSIIGHQRNCSAGSCTGHSARIYLYGDDMMYLVNNKQMVQKNFISKLTMMTMLLIIFKMDQVNIMPLFCCMVTMEPILISHNIVIQHKTIPFHKTAKPQVVAQ